MTPEYVFRTLKQIILTLMWRVAALEGGSGGGISQLTGHVAAGPGSGSQVATIQSGVVTEAMQVLADNTTQNVSITKHGYAPKAPNDADLFLNGVGGYSTPAGTGGTGNVTDTGATGAEPGSPTTGDLYFPDDGYAIERFDGSVWPWWGPIYPLTKPDDSAFSWLTTQGTASKDATYGGIYLKAPPAGAPNFQIRLYGYSTPSPPYTLTVCLIPDVTEADTSCGGLGIAWRESSSGKISSITLLPGHGQYWQYGWVNWSSPTTYNSEPASRVTTMTPALVWLRLVDDNTNRHVYYSIDGKHFKEVGTGVARTTYLTPDQFGVFLDAGGAFARVTAIDTALVSWKVE